MMIDKYRHHIFLRQLILQEEFLGYCVQQINISHQILAVLHDALWAWNCRLLLVMDTPVLTLMSSRSQWSLLFILQPRSYRTTI